MAQPQRQSIVIADLRGGRNGIDSPTAPDFPDNQCVEARNVDFSDGALGRRRGGMTALATTGGTAFATGMNALFRHMPGGDETAQELWAVDQQNPPITKRLAAGTTWADVSFDDAVSSEARDINFCSFNGKLFLFYNSTEDRLHCYDPSLASARVRRSGLATAAAPTTADTGAGTLNVSRYYRVRWIQIDGTRVVRRSDVGTASSLHTSVNAVSVVVTRPTAAGEGETHWEVEFSTDAVNWYGRFSFENGTHIAIATTTANDNAASGTEASYGQINLVESGSYSRFPSAKFGVTDGNRLIVAGSWESAGAISGGLSARIWFSAVLGSSDQGDDERWYNTTDIKGYIDLNEKDGGGITGLSMPANGVVLVFKYRQIWKLVPTGNVTAPYVARKINDTVGCIEHKTIVNAIDAAGRPCVYFLSAEGPYMYGVEGLQYIGRDVEDVWYGLNDYSSSGGVNLSSTLVTARGCYYPRRGLVLFWLAQGSGTATSIVIGLSIRHIFKRDAFGLRGGWVTWSGDIAKIRMASLFSTTPGSTMSRDLSLYIARTDEATIAKCDTTATDDDGTDFQAYVKTKSLRPVGSIDRMLGIAEPVITAKTLAATTIQLSLIRDFALETITDTASIAASGSELRTVRKFESALGSQFNVLQVQIGDAAAADVSSWSLDAVVLPVHDEGPV